MAPRITISSPLLIPPSIPPARLLGRRHSPPRPSMGSCTALPVRAAAAKASPISTPLMPGIESRAAPRRASRRRSHSTPLPRPAGTPRTETTKVPPKVSPSPRARSMGAASIASPSSVAHPRGEVRARSHPASSRGGGTETPPMESTAPRTAMPQWARRRRAKVPATVRGAVVRAEARSSTSRMSPWRYLRAPARSACPGRGAVMRRASIASGEVCQGSMAGAHRSASALARATPTGAPVVRPFLSPPHTWISSRSSAMRGPRPCPRRLRASSEARSSRHSSSPAGRPSTTTRSPRPCDSPLVRKRHVMMLPPGSPRSPGPGPWPPGGRPYP